VKRNLKRLFDLWATRSLLVGGVATIIDVSCMVTAVEVLHWPRVPAAMLGVAIGATANFLMNRYFAFRDHDGKLAPQAARYALTTGAAMLVHAGFVFVLTNLLGVFYVVSKLIADLIVFSGGHLLLMRFLVFPRAAAAPVEVGRPDEVERTPA
jgi:putative flippase GtrA